MPDAPAAVGIVAAIRDDAYIRNRHMPQGNRVVKELAKGEEAHVFLDEIDLAALENAVWTKGTFQGKVGTGHRVVHDRFIWRSPTPIGRRIQAGRAEVPLFWVEIKGKMNQGRWVYHLVPRPKPAGP